MTDDRIDFTPLDPTADAERFGSMAGRIAREAMAARPAGARSVPPGSDIFAALSTWTRPALIAAGLVVAASLPTIWRLRAPPPSPPAIQQLTGALGIPAAVTDLLRSTNPPPLTVLAAALGEGRK